MGSDSANGRSSSRTWCFYGLWLVILFVATLLRCIGPDWDAGIAAHPDERFLLGAAETTPLMGNVCGVVPEFPYGHFPVYLARILVMVEPDADPLFAARLLSALVGVLLVAMSGACAGVLAGRGAALLGAALAALAPGLIQQAHFYTVDPLGALFACGSVLAATRGRWRAAGVLTGLAVACKFSLGMGGLPLGVLALLRPSGRVGRRQALGFCLSTIAGFAIVSPWAILTPVACWEGPLIQSMLVAGRYVFPYTKQYVNTVPFLYPLVQMALWGLGPLPVGLGVFALLTRLVSVRQKPPAYLVPCWSWLIFYFASVAGLQVKFPRYMLPLYPWWTAWASAAVVGQRAPFGRTTRRVLATLAIATTGVLGLAQVGVYSTPHPWQTASEWLYVHIHSGEIVGVEAWEHPLPVPLPEEDSTAISQITIPIYDDENETKYHELATASETQVIVIASRRGYGALARSPVSYADTLAWYERLLSDRATIPFARCPSFLGVSITDDPLADAGLPVPVSLAERCGTPYVLRLPRLDESFRVYDAPLTLLLTRDAE